MYFVPQFFAIPSDEYYEQRYRSGHSGADSKSGYLRQKLNIFYTEVYRSGHNENDSKSFGR